MTVLPFRPRSPKKLIMSTQKIKRKFAIATEQEILAGRVTDVYFQRTHQILVAKGINKHVRLEVRLKRFPNGWDWGIFCGLEEALHFLEGHPLNVWALPEGTVFRAQEPVMIIETNYTDFDILETSLLGFLCQASGIASKAARSVIAAEGRPVVSFGIRRAHPAIALMIERSAFIGGCTGVASVLGAEYLDEEPVGTIPHALILILEDSTTAAVMFDQVIDKSVPRTVLVDTFGDEKFEALENANLLGKDLFAVRLDTPSSRRGDMFEIAREVRWELDIHGHEHVKIFISGGLDETLIPPLNAVADSYGVGTSISNARVFDFGLDIVEIEGEPVSKRGKLAGAKQLFVCSACGARFVRLWEQALPRCLKCNEDTVKPQLIEMIHKGKITRSLPSPQELRAFVIEQLPKSS